MRLYRGIRATAALGVIIATLSLASTAAATPPVIGLSFSHGTVTAPAGTLCDFAYRQDWVQTIRLELFYPTGVHTQAHFKQQITHTNLDTGFALTDAPVFNVIDSRQPNVATFNGVIWHLRDADGRPVTVEAGQIRQTFVMSDDGELITTDTFTPGLTPDFAEVICSALGGHPAD